MCFSLEAGKPNARKRKNIQLLIFFEYSIHGQSEIVLYIVSILCLHRFLLQTMSTNDNEIVL